MNDYFVAQNLKRNPKVKHSIEIKSDERSVHFLSRARSLMKDMPAAYNEMRDRMLSTETLMYINSNKPVVKNDKVMSIISDYLVVHVS